MIAYVCSWPEVQRRLILQRWLPRANELRDVAIRRIAVGGLRTLPACRKMRRPHRLSSNREPEPVAFVSEEPSPSITRHCFSLRRTRPKWGSRLSHRNPSSAFYRSDQQRLNDVASGGGRRT